MVDIWALGCILHEIFVGRPPPFAHPHVLTDYCRGDEYALNILNENEGISISARGFTRKLLESDRNKRPTATLAKQEKWIGEWVGEKKKEVEGTEKWKRKCEELEKELEEVKFQQQADAAALTQCRELLDKTKELQLQRTKELEKTLWAESLMDEKEKLKMDLHKTKDLCASHETRAKLYQERLDQTDAVLKQERERRSKEISEAVRYRKRLSEKSKEFDALEDAMERLGEDYHRLLHGRVYDRRSELLAREREEWQQGMIQLEEKTKKIQETYKNIIDEQEEEIRQFGQGFEAFKAGRRRRIQDPLEEDVEVLDRIQAKSGEMFVIPFHSFRPDLTIFSDAEGTSQSQQGKDTTSENPFQSPFKRIPVDRRPTTGEKAPRIHRQKREELTGKCACLSRCGYKAL